MKFISELDLSNPNDAEEMRRHTFGTNYRQDASGQPLEQGRGSAIQFASGKHADSTEAHLRAVEKNEGAAAAKAERERIMGGQKKAHPLIKAPRPSDI